MPFGPVAASGSILIRVGWMPGTFSLLGPLDSERLNRPLLIREPRMLRGAEPAADLSSAATRKARRRVILMIGVYAAVFSAYSLMRYYSFRSLFYDLGIFSYSMSQVTQGLQGIQTLLLPSTPGHVGHFSPILIVPLAFYALLPSPATLLVLQSLVLALAALPLFELSLTVLHRLDVSTTIVAVYLLYPALQGVNRYDFHVESFIPLLSFALFLVLVQRRYRAFVGLSLLLLCTHEYLSIVFLWTAGILLVYQVLRHKDVVVGLVSRRWAATMFGLGAAFFALENLLNILLTPTHLSIFSWLGITTSSFTGGVGDLLGGVATDVPLKLLYWALLLAPLLLLPLREWRLALPVVPWLGLTVFASNPGIYSLYTQYSAFVLPFLFFATIWSLRRPTPIPRIRISGRRLCVALVAVGLLCTAAVGPLSPLNSYDGLLSNGFAPPYPPTVTAHDHGTATILGVIPRDATVLAQNELFSQVSDRAEVSIDWNLSTTAPPQYIAVDTSRTWFVAPVPPLPHSLETLVPQLLGNESYGIAAFSGSAFVYRLGGALPPSLTTRVASLPASPADLTDAWTLANASASVTGSGLSLEPQAGRVGTAWTRVVPNDGVLVSAALSWSPGSTDAWFGVTFGQPGTPSFQAVTVVPVSGQVEYLRYADGALASTFLGPFTATGNSTTVVVALSGGVLQVWVGGSFVRFLPGVSASGPGEVGVAAAGRNLTVTSFDAYRSNAADAAPSGALPWDGIAAFGWIVAPALVVLFVEPRPSQLVAKVLAFLRKIVGGRV